MYEVLLTNLILSDIVLKVLMREILFDLKPKSRQV